MSNKFFHSFWQITQYISKLDKLFVLSHSEFHNPFLSRDWMDTDGSEYNSSFGRESSTNVWLFMHIFALIQIFFHCKKPVWKVFLWIQIDLVWLLHLSCFCCLKSSRSNISDIMWDNVNIIFDYEIFRKQTDVWVKKVPKKLHWD